MANDSGVHGAASVVSIGGCAFVVFKIDFVGLHSFEGGSSLSSDFNLGAEFVKDGGLMYLVHGEKFTRLDCRVDGARTELSAAKGESTGVCTTMGESSVRSFSDSIREPVLGGVGGRADTGPTTSTIFQADRMIKEMRTGAAREQKAWRYGQATRLRPS